MLLNFSITTSQSLIINPHCKKGRSWLDNEPHKRCPKSAVINKNIEANMAKTSGNYVCMYV